jgi:hypothetical protein
MPNVGRDDGLAEPTTAALGVRAQAGAVAQTMAQRKARVLVMIDAACRELS